MELHELTAWQVAEMLGKREVSATEVVNACFARVEAVEDRVRAFITQTREQALQQARIVDERRAGGTPAPRGAGEVGEAGASPLRAAAGVPIAHKDLLCTTGVLTTCASKILHNFVPPYTATVVRRCDEAGLPMVGKTNMDEFAMGSSTENSGFHVTANPWNLACVPGGSSGGSAAAVAAGEAFWALGSDTGGSIRQPASLCGLVGMKPTYGRVSRYGVVAYASSLDQVGPLTKDVRDCALLLGIIAGKDERDSTSADLPVPDYTANLGEEVQGLKCGIVHELLFGEGVAPEVRAAVEAAVKTLEGLGVRCEEVSLPNSEYSLPCYYIIAPAECSSNLARYDGVRYGHRTSQPTDDIYDMFAKTRAEGFGPEVRLRIIKGTYVLSAGYYDAYYKKALQVRTLIKQDFERAYETYDFLLCPTSPTVAFKIGEKADDPLAMKLADICTLPINLAGIPAMSLPCGMSEGLPIGMQLMGKPFDEPTLLKVAYAYEQATEWHGMRAEL